MRLGRAIVHIGQHQPVGVGVLAHLQNIADHNLLGVPGQLGALDTDPLDLIDLQAKQRQPLRQLLERDRHIDKFFEPRKWYTHILLSISVLDECVKRKT